MLLEHITTDPAKIRRIPFTLRYKKPLAILTFEPCLVTLLTVINSKYLLSMKIGNRKIAFKDRAFIYEKLDVIRIKIGDVEREIGRKHKVGERASGFFLNKDTKMFRECVMPVNETERREMIDLYEENSDSNDEDEDDGNNAGNVVNDIFADREDVPCDLLNSIEMFGIVITQKERDEYLHSLNMRCAMVVKKYIDNHRMDFSVKYEDDVLAHLRHLLKNERIDEIEDMLRDILKNRPEIIAKGPYEAVCCIDNRHIGRHCFYVEDENGQRIVSYDNKFTVLDLKTVKHKESGASALNLAHVTSYYPLSRGLSFFVLMNDLYIVRKHMIVKKVRINELKWINNHKILLFGDTVLLIGGSRNMHGADEYNPIIEVKGVIDNGCADEHTSMTRGLMNSGTKDGYNSITEVEVKGMMDSGKECADGTAIGSAHNSIYDYKDDGNNHHCKYELSFNTVFQCRTRFNLHRYKDIIIIVGGRYGRHKLQFVEYYHLVYRRTVCQVPFPVRNKDTKLHSVIAGKILFVIFNYDGKNALYAFEIERAKWQYIGNLAIDFKGTLALGPEDVCTNSDQPDSNKPGSNQPDSNKPDSNKPDSNKPDSNQPGSDKPDSDHPDSDAGKDGERYHFYILKTSKRYKIEIERRSKESMLNKLIIRLRSYFFLLNYDLEYAQRKIYPLVADNEVFYRMLILKCYSNEKISFNDIFEEISNFFVEDMRVIKENVEDLFK